MQGLAVIQDIIRKQVAKDPTFSDGIGFARMCRDFKLYDLLAETPHQFITVALPNSYPLGKLDTQLTTKINKWLADSLAVVEYHSKSGENLHIHILRQGNYSKPKIIRDLSRKFKVDRNFIDVKRSVRDVDYKNRYNYIKGIKVDDDKSEYVEKDREWRKQSGLRELYNL